LFGFDRYTIPKDNISYLKELAGLLQKYPDIQIRVVGYTDAIGSRSYNNALSVRRARQVAVYLFSCEIGEDRIIVSGRGEESPVAINNNADGTDNPEGRRYNRRAEIYLDQTPVDLMLMKQVHIPEALRIK
jgi:outer membrane protein OmpA-like peptidoglycan-associated protein